MDPATILGAVGSIVGIAAFSLKLAQFIDTFISDYGSAAADLTTILEGIESVHLALEQVREFLQQEEKNVRGGGAAQLFSGKALKQVRTTSDKCLKIFWRIEAVVLRRGEVGDAECRRRLGEWHRVVEEEVRGKEEEGKEGEGGKEGKKEGTGKGEGIKQGDWKVGEGYLKLDGGLKIRKIDKWKWSFNVKALLEK